MNVRRVLCLMFSCAAVREVLPEQDNLCCGFKIPPTSIIGPVDAHDFKEENKQTRFWFFVLLCLRVVRGEWEEAREREQGLTLSLEDGIRHFPERPLVRPVRDSGVNWNSLRCGDSTKIS